MVGNHRTEIVLAGPLDGFLRAGERHPHRRMRLLIGPRPDRNVLVRPVFALVGELRLGPCLENDLDRLLEARPRLAHRHAVHVVFARHAAGEARENASPRHRIGHRQLFGDAERIVQRHEIAEHQELQLLGPLRGDRRHHVRRVHHAVRRGVVLVQADARRSRACPSPPRLGGAARRSAPRPQDRSDRWPAGRADTSSPCTDRSAFRRRGDRR
jgi:hypothetical protein